MFSLSYTGLLNSGDKTSTLYWVAMFQYGYDFVVHQLMPFCKMFLNDLNGQNLGIVRSSWLNLDRFEVLPEYVRRWIMVENVSFDIQRQNNIFVTKEQNLLGIENIEDL